MKIYLHHVIALKRAISGSWTQACIFLFAAAASALPTRASAAPSFGFDYTCSDRSISDYLAPIFGALFEKCGGGGSGAFEKAMGVLNAGALTIGGLLAAYTLIAGTMQTAHDGEMLGKKWSSMWLPIRTALGVGLVVPVGGGYCVAQLLVGFLMGQGVGFADSVWTTYLTTFATPKGMAPQSRLPNVSELARGVLQSQLCMEAYNATIEGTAIATTKMAMSAVASNIHNYGLNGDVQCGGVKFDKIEYDKLKMSADNAATGMHVMPGTTIDPVNLSKIDDAHITALAAMESSLAATAKKLITFRDSAGAAPDVVGDLNRSVVAYQTQVTGAVDSVFGQDDAMKSFMQAAKSDGWYMAGAWFMKATQMQDAISQAISRVPEVTSPDAQFLAPYAKSMAVYFVQVDNVLRTSAQAQTTLDSTTDSVSSLAQSSNPFKAVMGWVTKKVFGGLQVNPNRNALMSIKDIGDYVMTGSEVAMVGGVTLISAAQGANSVNGSFWGEVAGVVSLGTTKFAAGAGAGAATVLGYLLLAVGSIFFGLGSAIAIYLPFAPFLLFFGAFIGWLILCAEAVIAAPLWAVMHISPSGDDVMGGARAGYMLLLGLLLRPALIVLGFIFALTAVDVIAQGFNGVFFPAFKLAMAGSVMGLGTGLVMLCIYFGTMVWIFHTVFGLIHVIPDKILRWIGGGGEQLGESARGMSKAGESGAGSASRHTDALRQNAMTGIGAAANVAATRKGASDARERDAVSQRSQSQSASTKAAISTAKADTPNATAEDDLSAVADLTQSAQQESEAENASQKAGHSTPESRQASQAKVSSAMGKATARVAGMESKAAKLESSIASAPAAEQPAAISAAKAQYTASAHGYEIVGDQGKADAMHQKAAEVGRTPPPAAATPASGPGLNQ